MSRKSVISLLLLALYIAATGANSFGILRCDCAAHHSHDLCCNHHHHQDGEHDRSLCAAFCLTEDCIQSIADRCSCNHRHGENAACTIVSDPDELSKIIRAFTGEPLRTQNDIARTALPVRTLNLKIADDIPIAAPPVLSAGAPRAPSFSA